MRIASLWVFAVWLVFMAVSLADAQNPANKKPAKKTETKKPAKKNVQLKKQPSSTATPGKKVVEKKPAAAEPTPDAVADEKKVRDIVSVLEFMLNALASRETSTRDKEVIITNGYSKIFRDAKVQVEDDLVSDRLVITNKDIVAYLKDVDFFFDDAKFEFTIDGIQGSVNADNKHFYKVSLTRNLKGTTTDGVPVNNTLARFIEINYDLDAQDLKIVSIYTTAFSGKDALVNWWTQLSFEWQAIFKKKLNIVDSVSTSDLRSIAAIEDLDVSDNEFITSVEPVSFLSKLKKLNISHTKTADLIAIRNLTDLTELAASHTAIKDISVLKYSNNLTRLNIEHTAVADISVVEKMPMLLELNAGNTSVSDFSAVSQLANLEVLNAEGSQISNLSSVESLTKLKELNLSRTQIHDLNSLAHLKELATLEIDSTQVSNLAPLSTVENLKVLHANATAIASLQPLQKLKNLERVYCDQTPIRQPAANAFMAANPKVLVIYDSKDMRVWWDSLPAVWQEILIKNLKISQSPTKEELAKVTSADSINLGANSRIKDLEPLRKLPKLTAILAYNTGITDLAALEALRDIVYLDISETNVADISVTRQLTKLKILQADKSKIENISPLNKLTNLEKVYVDQTGVQDFIAAEFLEKNPKVLLVYKTLHLNRWWKNLSDVWKEVMRSQMPGDTVASRENLHKLVERTAVTFKDVAVNDLTALNEFVHLRDIDFSGTSITAIPAMENLKSLRSLHATNGPLQNLAFIGQLSALEDLDISNTPIDDLKLLENLEHLKKLNCGGTQIRRIDAVEKMSNLEAFDCSNTRVGNIDPLLPLPLKSLKCYNTKVTSREVEGFKKKKPDCNVVFYK
jgi:hypothetical protein